MAVSQVDAETVSSIEISAADRLRIFTYFAILICVLDFGSPNGGMIDTPILFFLKNRLHLDAQGVAHFRLITGIPLYLLFVLGFIRDNWNPFGMRDRGYFVLFGSLTAAIYVWLAFSPITYSSLLIGCLILTTSYRFISAAWQGLLSLLGQEHVLSGRLSTLWNSVAVVPAIAALYLGGVFSDFLGHSDGMEAARTLFLSGAAIILIVVGFGIWKPAAVFNHAYRNPKLKIDLLNDLKRLATHWPLYPPIIIYLLWNFSPGGGTPLQFFLTDKLHASNGQFGAFNALVTAAFLPSFMVFGYFCTRVPLSRQLWWGTAIGVGQWIPLIFVTSINSALLVAIPIGLTGGIASAAYADLLIRSCPRGLQGTVMMLAVSMIFIAARWGDVYGTYLYKHGFGWNLFPQGGFVPCAIATTVVYFLIFPVLLLVPKRLISTRDGQITPETAAMACDADVPEA